MLLILNRFSFGIFCFLIYGINKNLKIVQAGSVHLPGMGSKIINGKRAIQNQFPYHVSVRVDKRFCGGSIISTCFVLTARHCTRGAKNATVIYGTTKAFRDICGTAEVSIEIFEPKTMTEDPNFIHDMALIQVKPFPLSKSVQIIKLEKNLDKDYTGVSAVVAGWGRTTSNVKGGRSMDLQYTNLTIINRRDVRNYSNSYKCSETIIFTSTAHNTSVCTGDSGSGLTVDGVLVGVTSFVSKLECNSSEPAGFARVAYFYKWIKETTDKCGCKLED